MDKSEADILARTEEDLKSMDPQVGLTTIPVDGVIERSADFWGSVEDAKVLGKITDEQYAEALDFFGTLFPDGVPDENALAELNYVEEMDELRVVLPSPEERFFNGQDKLQ